MVVVGTVVDVWLGPPGQMQSGQGLCRIRAALSKPVFVSIHDESIHYELYLGDTLPQVYPACGFPPCDLYRAPLVYPP